MQATDPTTSNDIATHCVRGSVMLVGGRVLGILLNFGVQVLTVRYLPKNDYGIFAFALSVAMVVSVISVFGVDKAASRFLPVYLQQRDYGRFWGMLVLLFTTVLGLGALATLFFLVIWGLGAPLLTTNESTQLVLAITAGLAFCDALTSLFTSLFAVLASPAAIFFRRHLLGPLLKLAAVTIVIVTSGDLYAFAAGQLVAGILGVMVCVVMLRKLLAQHVDLRAALSERLIFPFRQLYSYSVTLLSGELAYLLRGALVPIVLGLLFASEEVARYQAVMPVARLIGFILLTFSVLFLPSSSRLAGAKQHSELQTLFERTTTWVTLLSFPIFAVFFLTSDYIPVLLFGTEYESSGSILAWLAIGFYTNASFGSSLRLLRASGRLRTLLAADLLLVCASLALVFWLVALYGAIGGAWAVCGTYVFQSIIYHVLVARTTQVNPFKVRCIAPFVLGLSLCVLGAAVREGLGAGPAFGLTLAVFSSLAVLAIFGRQLDVAGTFPELTALPFVRRWIEPAATSRANSS